MKNTKEKIYSKLHKVLNVTISNATFIGLYFFMIWATADLNPYFFKIDRCLDRGGAWDQQSLTCRYE